MRSDDIAEALRKDIGEAIDEFLVNARKGWRFVYKDHRFMWVDEEGNERNEGDDSKRN